MPNSFMYAKMLFIIKVCVFMLLVWTAWGNLTICTTTYEIKNKKIPKEFDGFRIVEIADFHNSDFGEYLIRKISVENPDIIVITGDLLSSYRPNNRHVFEFIKNAVKIAPCFFVTGNHEARFSDYEEIEKILIDFGVRVLKDEAFILERNGEKISIWGIDDPAFEGKSKTSREIIGEKLEKFPTPSEFTVLLSHRPEAFREYVNKEVDLALTGHTHGGQIRLPFVGGIVAPNQGFFPKYDAGLFTENGTSMIISRGVGHSAIPLRVNNRSEVVVVELRKEKKDD